jgi:hypothetical protein
MMKRRERIFLGSIAVLLVVIGVLAMVWPSAQPRSRGPQQAKFIGLTKIQPGFWAKTLVYAGSSQSA